jgi:hypothetical protein
MPGAHIWRLKRLHHGRVWRRRPASVGGCQGRGVGYCVSVDHQRAAEVQVVLEGISLPASRAELVRYASREDAEAADALALIPEGDYDCIDAVGEALVSTALRRRQDASLPKPESGAPPGGSDYVNAHPQSGAVRRSAPRGNPPKKTLEEQTKTQKRQQAAQGG